MSLAIYLACVDVLLQATALFGISYRDANALLFFVVWPLVTLMLIGVVFAQAIALLRRP